MAEALARPRFEMRGVGKRFGATIALDRAELAVRPGEVCALVGQNGEFGQGGGTGSIADSFATGNVSGGSNSFVGGLVGRNELTATITGSGAAGDVNISDATGSGASLRSRTSHKTAK
jgi:ABC-type uncharacterized transport system ATPase subunit